MPPVAATFAKQERIVSRRLMEQLFGGGSSHALTAYPLRAVYMETERASDMPPVQILVSVPKRRFKHAVDRNRVKRQVREAYRLNKQLLWQAVPTGQAVAVAFIWLSDQHADSARVASCVKSLLDRIGEKVNR